MRDRGQSAHRANTVGHSGLKMRHEISGCLKGIGSRPFACVCYVSSSPCGSGDAAVLRSALPLAALSLALIFFFFLTHGPHRRLSL